MATKGGICIKMKGNVHCISSNNYTNETTAFLQAYPAYCHNNNGIVACSFPDSIKCTMTSNGNYICY